jgi:hypothetical protein
MATSGESYYRSFMNLMRVFHHLIPSLTDIEEKRKRYLVVGCLLLAIPMMVLFIIGDFQRHNTYNLIMDAVALFTFMVTMGALVKIQRGIILYRLLIGVVTALVFYNILAAPNGESSLMWVFVFPPVVFFVLGLTEGAVWFLIVLMFCAAVLGFPQALGTHPYLLETRIVFFSMFMIFAGLAIGYEVLRWYFYTSLEKQRSELKEALENVNTLSGLLPICSICKKIRDDRGYWNQLEAYLSRHTDARFSHGVCDDCYREKYPEVYAKRAAQREGAVAGTTVNSAAGSGSGERPVI